MKKKLLFLGLFMVAAAGMFASSNDASAYTIVQNQIPAPLNAHHKEATITAMPGEIVYLPMPPSNFPVHVQISVPAYEIGQVMHWPLVISFSTAVGIGMSYPDLPGQRMTAPVVPTVDGQTVTNCSDVDAVSAGVAYIFEGAAGPCFGSYDPQAGINDIFVVGVTDPIITGQPAKVFMTISKPTPNGGGPVTFYVNAWY